MSARWFCMEAMNKRPSLLNLPAAVIYYRCSTDLALPKSASAGTVWSLLQTKSTVGYVIPFIPLRKGNPFYKVLWK